MSDFRRALTGCIALMLALATIGGAVMMADSHTESQLSPVGDSKALAPVPVAVGAVVVGAYACDKGYICDSPDAEEMAKVDALETKKELHQQALTQRQNNDNWHTQVSNELEDTKSVARMIGKNEYIRELNNDTDEAVARAEAKEAVADYYSVRQKMMISQWETTLYRADSMEFTAQNTSNMSESYVEQFSTSLSNFGDSYSVQSSNFAYFESNESVPLANGTTVTVPYGKYQATLQDSMDSGYSETVTKRLSIDMNDHTAESDGGGYVHFSPVTVQAPTDNYESVEYIDGTKWGDRWAQINQKNNEVQNEVDDFVNTTYDQYQSGEITNEELIDPYIGARNYDPENSSSWALRSATAMGIAPPENTGDIDTMEITNGGTNVSGLLMTEGEYTIKTGETYNASNQTGSQYVLDTDTGEMSELEGEYTVHNITGPDGESRDAAEYTDINYETTNVTEFKNRMEELNNLTAQIEARQQKLRNAGSSSQVFPELPGSGAAQAAALGLVIALLAILGAAIAKP